MPCPLVFAHGAHVHGVGELSIAIENSKLTFAFQVPTESVFGFETEPKTKEQKTKKEEALTLLRTTASNLFQLNESLACIWATQKVDVIKSGESGHQDLQAEWTATCTKTPVGTELKIHLGSAFPRIERLKVNVLKDAGQTSTTLKSGKGMLKL